MDNDAVGIVLRQVSHRVRLSQGEAHDPTSRESGWEIWLRNPGGRLDYLGFETTFEAATAPYRGGQLPIYMDEAFGES